MILPGHLIDANAPTFVSTGSASEGHRIHFERCDSRVQRELRALTAVPNYWDFRQSAQRDALHGVTQYPAMMVPAMQGKLLDVVNNVIGEPVRLVDPFVGSGTTLVEAMRRGIPFVGQDINPLAVLISKSKAGPFKVAELECAVEQVLIRAREDRSRKPEASFPNIEKWFQPPVIDELSRLRRAIRHEDDLWVRRMLWVSLAETIRLSSNSRTSTFKLHIRPNDEVVSRHVETVHLFKTIATKAIDRVRQEVSLLAEAGHVVGGKYIGSTDVEMGRSHESLPGTGSFDLLVTSPPYGDGVTTVPYGQYSYLPLQWIDLQDISDGLDESCLTSTHEIDTRALGGSRRDALVRVQAALAESPRLKRYMEAMAGQPSERHFRVASFFADFTKVLDTVCERIRPGGYMIWTTGNRRVGGLVQPLDEILTELLEFRGCVLVSKLERSIPSKRMASRNSISQTMRSEHVLIMRSSEK